MVRKNRPKVESWEVEDDLRTIKRAEEIKASRNRMSSVKKLMKKEIVALNKAIKSTK